MIHSQILHVVYRIIVVRHHGEATSDQVKELLIHAKINIMARVGPWSYINPQLHFFSFPQKKERLASGSY